MVRRRDDRGRPGDPDVAVALARSEPARRVKAVAAGVARAVHRTAAHAAPHPSAMSPWRHLSARRSSRGSVPERCSAAGASNTDLPRHILGHVTESESKDLPAGDYFLETLFELEGQCEEATGRYLPHAGERAPQTWKSLGDGLAVLDALSSCFWGCRGGDHAVEHLLGRVFGSLRAAVRLARGGFYDEALNVLRTAGEVTNLLMLFTLDRTVLESWRNASANERFTLARPSKVIRRLASLGHEELSTNAAKYDLLSRLTHGNSTDAPQAHNPIGLPITAGQFQEAGFLVTLNESALIVSFAIFSGVSLSELDQELSISLLRRARTVVLNTGSVGLTNVQEALAAQRESILVQIGREARSKTPRSLGTDAG